MGGILYKFVEGFEGVVVLGCCGVGEAVGWKVAESLLTDLLISIWHIS